MLTAKRHAKPSKLRFLGAGQGFRGPLAVTAVALFAGLLIGTSVATAHRATASEGDLVSIVRTRSATVEALEEQVHDLNDQVQTKLDEARPLVLDDNVHTRSRQQVEGPGIVVTMSDAATEFVPAEGTDVNEMVVHSQDVEAVLNALWRGGADGITVQGVRLAVNTPVRCVGNVILVGTRAYAPPYVIEAVGPQENMIVSLDADERIQAFKRDAARYHMGWDVFTKQDLVLPPATDVTQVQLARPVAQT